MADNKKYYYLKLKESFFDSDAMILLESMDDGYLYSNILLKLYLRSLKNEGKLMFNDRIPYNPGMIAKITRHSVGVVEKAINIFNELELIEVLDNGAIYIIDIQNFIGESSTEADRIRLYRKRIDKEKIELASECTNVQQMNDKCTPELEIELDIDIERDIEIKKEIKKNVVYFDDVDLNSAFKDYLDMRKKIKAPMTDRAVELAVNKLNKMASDVNEKTQILEQSIMNSWKGLFPLKEKIKQTTGYSALDLIKEGYFDED